MNALKANTLKNYSYFKYIYFIILMLNFVSNNFKIHNFLYILTYIRMKKFYNRFPSMWHLQSVFALISVVFSTNQQSINIPIKAQTIHFIDISMMPPFSAIEIHTIKFSIFFYIIYVVFSVEFGFRLFCVQS